MNREWVTRSIPLLIFTGLVLYADRIVRREVIVDSSAMVATVFVAHLLNVCRSSIAHVDHYSVPQSDAVSAASAYYYRYHSQHHQHQLSVVLRRELEQLQAGGGGGGSWNHNTSIAAAQLYSPQMLQLLSLTWWQEGLVYATYALVSMLLVMDVDVVSAVSHALQPLLPLSSSPPSTSTNHKRTSPITYPSSTVLPRSILQLACWHNEDQHPMQQQQHYQQWAAATNMLLLQPVSIRISTVATHCVLVGLVLQMDVSSSEGGSLFMTPSRIVTRSFVFTCLSICWTYVAGVHKHTNSGQTALKSMH